MTNGTIQYSTLNGGGINNDGDPVQIVEEWSEPVECLIITKKHDNRGQYQDGEFSKITYFIHIDMVAFDAGRVRITNKPSGWSSTTRISLPSSART